VVGAGLGTVTLSGVEVVNLTTTGTVGVNGTAANDAFTASPYSANGVSFALAGLNTVLNASTTAALTLDPAGGTNGVTVNGTVAGPETMSNWNAQICEIGVKSLNGSNGSGVNAGVMTKLPRLETTSV
jgi:hypothetical protein